MRNNLQSLLTLCWLWIVLQERAWECLPGEREKECLRWPSPILRQNFCQFWKKHQRCHLYQAVLKMFTRFRKFRHSNTLGVIFDIKVLFNGKFCYDEKMWLTELFCQEKKISLMARTRFVDGCFTRHCASLHRHSPRTLFPEEYPRDK